MSMPDEELVARIVQGDQELYRLLIERYRGMLYGLVYGVLRHPKDAEDALQEALMRIYLSLPQCKQQNVKAWMCRIAVNCAIDLRRSVMRKQAVVILAGASQGAEEQAAGVQSNGSGPQQAVTGTGDGWVHDGSGCSPPAESIALARERRERVEALVESMPDGYGSVVRAFYLEDKSQREIAEAEKLEVKSVESRLYRAKQWMRKHWKEEDLT